MAPSNNQSNVQAEAQHMLGAKRLRLRSKFFLFCGENGRYHSVRREACTSDNKKLHIFLLRKVAKGLFLSALKRYAP